MKQFAFFCLLTVCVGFSGCTYTGAKTALQPGDSIIFTTGDRANEFRAVSGNDAQNAGRVVAITRPAVVVTE